MLLVPLPNHLYSLLPNLRFTQGDVSTRSTYISTFEQRIQGNRVLHCRTPDQRSPIGAYCVFPTIKKSERENTEPNVYSCRMPRRAYQTVEDAISQPANRWVARRKNKKPKRPRKCEHSCPASNEGVDVGARPRPPGIGPFLPNPGILADRIHGFPAASIDMQNLSS